MPPLRILVTGATGFLGAHVAAAVRAAGHDLCTSARSGGDAAVDLAAPGMVGAVVQALRPDVVLHLAACSRIADCEHDPARARAVNVHVPRQLAERFGARFVLTSTDLVFDGRHAPYDERAPVAPLSVYGCTKAEAEEHVRAHGGRVVRLPLLFGPDALGRGASASLRRALAGAQPAALFTNEYRTPLHAADAAAALVELVEAPDGPALLHLPGPERLSRWDFALRLCAAHGLRTERLQPVECLDPLRPRDVALAGAWTAPRDLAAMLADA